MSTEDQAQRATDSWNNLENVKGQEEMDENLGETRAANSRKLPTVLLRYEEVLKSMADKMI